MSHFNSPDGVGRRAFLQRSAQAVVSAGLSLGAVGVALSALPGIAGATGPEMTVYKDPNCGCCKAWVAHVQKAGFVVTVRDTADMDSVKASFGVPSALQSCHTARVGSYVIEGHVPADLIQKLLAERPAARGLTAPGMPVGSPGMEMGARKDAYDILLIDKAGRTTVYASR